MKFHIILLYLVAIFLVFQASKIPEYRERLKLADSLAQTLALHEDLCTKNRWKPTGQEYRDVCQLTGDVLTAWEVKR